MRGKEKRVKLVQAMSPEDQLKYVESADLVIWAAGYQTGKISISDSKGHKIQLSSQVMHEQTTLAQYDVNSDCKLYLADGNYLIDRMYGTGIGYPQRRSDGIILPKKQNTFDVTFYKYPKVDSFDMYRTNVGSSISKNILDQLEKKNQNHFTEEGCNKIRNASNCKFKSDVKIHQD